jgi:iron complex outermembrane recepter protein
LNEAAAYTSAATNSKFLEETISAAYARGDMKFFQNRLWLVGGVRFEKTEDHGFGLLDDIRATYRQDANGNLLRDAAGRAIPVTTNALESAKLRYTVRGAESRKDYQGYYPSFNTTYYLTDALVLRAAYAKTIGRPRLAEIIPGISITDPESASIARTITVTNTGLSGQLRPLLRGLQYQGCRRLLRFVSQEHQKLFRRNPGPRDARAPGRSRFAGRLPRL